jgi:hypothetical protein
MPEAQGTHVPVPLQTPPGQAVPAATLPEVVHTGPPDEQLVVPVVHALPVLHDEPDAQGMHAPLPSHTPEGHAVPGGRWLAVTHTGAPLVQSIRPVSHVLLGVHEDPETHATHAPDPSHTPPVHTVPAG